MSVQPARLETADLGLDTADLDTLRAALQESEARYHSLFEGCRDAIYVTAHDGRFLDVNSSFVQLFGYTRDDLLGLNARVLYADPADRKRFQKEIEHADAVRDFEVRLKTQSGRVLDCLFSSSVRRAADGSVISYQGILHDVTSRKQSQSALEQSEHFTRTVIASVGEGVIAFDRDLRCRVWNRFMEELTGISADRLIGKEAHAHLPRLASYRVDDLLERALGGEVVTSNDTPYHLAQTGQVRWIATRCGPLLAADGSIDGVVAIVHDVTERKLAEQQMLHGAFHDPLTGLPNRALFIDRLASVIARAQGQPGYSFGVLFLDLDRFKLINDSLGHWIGDQLLVAIARRLEGCVRQGDTVARLGGDEFAILIEHLADPGEATRIAERALAEVATTFTLDGHEVYTSTSIGIAISQPGYERPDDVIRDADAAMYRAKSEGRARYEIFDRRMRTDALEALQLETDLRRALERGEFVLHYQPIVSLESGELTAFEALLRWDHPQRGRLWPAEFIALAEETGLIIPIGWWVLREACSQMREWQLRFAGEPPLSISVNLSTRQFLQADLVERIDDILSAADFDPRLLRLEITESGVMQNATAAAAMLAALRLRGIRVCIDDFGTGYSSLSYLHAFPIDTLKIDKSFISTVDEEGSSIELIETIVALSRILGMEAVAEGVETPQQLELVRRLGSGFAQGYQISHPLPAAEAESLIRLGTRW
ncbi:MAG: putative bifunctional diguanylate cyclase/phosphodiesterase [Longimicrobiales bacterium]